MLSVSFFESSFHIGLSYGRFVCQKSLPTCNFNCFRFPSQFKFYSYDFNYICANIIPVDFVGDSTMSYFRGTLSIIRRSEIVSTCQSSFSSYLKYFAISDSVYISLNLALTYVNLYNNLADHRIIELAFYRSIIIPTRLSFSSSVYYLFCYDNIFALMFLTINYDIYGSLRSLAS